MSLYMLYTDSPLHLYSHVPTTYIYLPSARASLPNHTPPTTPADPVTPISVQRLLSRLFCFPISFPLFILPVVTASSVIVFPLLYSPDYSGLFQKSPSTFLVHPSPYLSSSFPPILLSSAFPWWSTSWLLQLPHHIQARITSLLSKYSSMTVIVDSSFR